MEITSFGGRLAVCVLVRVGGWAGAICCCSDKGASLVLRRERVPKDMLHHLATPMRQDRKQRIRKLNLGSNHPTPITITIDMEKRTYTMRHLTAALQPALGRRLHGPLSELDRVVPVDCEGFRVWEERP